MKCRDITAKDDPTLKAIAQLYEFIFPALDRNIVEEFRFCVLKLSGAVSVLEEDKQLWGVSRCLPISETTYDAIISSRLGVQAFITPEAILSDGTVNRNVIEGFGNHCFVGMVVWDPVRKLETYRQHAMALFAHLRNRFYRIRIRKLVCQANYTPTVFAISIYNEN